MAAELKSIIGRMLVLVHPQQIGIQKGLIDLLWRQGIQKAQTPKVGEEAIHRVAYPPQMVFWSWPDPVQTIRLEKARNILGADG